MSATTRPGPSTGCQTWEADGSSPGSLGRRKKGYFNWSLSPRFYVTSIPVQKLKLIKILRVEASKLFPDFIEKIGSKIPLFFTT